MYRSFYRDPADVGELTESLGLAGKRHDYYKSLSGGQRQRLSVALALIGRPKIAVLDEMTTGLDPQARRDAWDLIEGVRDRGVTVILVTHFMEEAERLCDRVALIDNGRVVALDTPARLASQTRAGASMRFLPSAPFDDRLLTALPEVTRVDREGQHVVVTGTGDLASAVILALAAAGVTARDLFFAGLWLPRALMPDVLLTISNYTPLGAAVEAIQSSMLQGFPPTAPLLVLAGYALVFGFLARRFFRWE
jgi:ABC-2 type transport system ATP-binding protein